MERPVQKLNDLSRCLTSLQPDGTVIEMTGGRRRHPTVLAQPVRF